MAFILGSVILLLTVVPHQVFATTSRPSFSMLARKDNFVTVQGTSFKKNGKDLFLLSANYWQGANMGAVASAKGNRDQLAKDLDHLKSVGVNNIRVMAGSEGPRTEPFRIDMPMMESPGFYNLDILDGLDYCLEELRKRDMTATMVLTNYWQWSGGFAQYVSWVTKTPIPYPDSWNGTAWTGADYAPYMAYTDKFYTNDAAQKLYFDHVKAIIARTNKYSNLPYTQDPAILAWELANEPQHPPQKWVRETAALIKSLDPNHLVATGHEAKEDFNDFYSVNSIPGIDFATVHIWAQNRGIYNMTDPSEKNIKGAIDWGVGWINTVNDWAVKMKKPLVLEEFGFPRDNWVDSGDNYVYSPKHPITRRDRYYKAMMQRTVELRKSGAYTGVGFWAYAGESRPGQSHWLGDPPQEPPGWYSVYNTDSSTLDIIRSISKATI